MTGQMHDQFLFKGETYNYVSSTPSKIFDPNDLEITTYSSNTACWRGFLLFFTIKDKKLILQAILLNTKEEPPIIKGVTPKKKISWFDYNYDELNYEPGFSGEIIIAKDFIKELYVHGGYQAGTSYETVFKLGFEKDQLIKIEDISSMMKKMRIKPQTNPNKI